MHVFQSQSPNKMPCADVIISGMPQVSDADPSRLLSPSEVMSLAKNVHTVTSQQIEASGFSGWWSPVDRVFASVTYDRSLLDKHHLCSGRNRSWLSSGALAGICARLMPVDFTQDTQQRIKMLKTTHNVSLVTAGGVAHNGLDAATCCSVPRNRVQH